MTPMLQGYKHDRPVYVNPGTMVKCRICAGTHPIVANDYSTELIDGCPDGDVMELLELELNETGWVKMCCPYCVQTKPDSIQ